MVVAHSRTRANQAERGTTLVELIVAMTILGVLSMAAIPPVIFMVKRERERILRRDLWEMRQAIDQYKMASDNGLFSNKAGSEGYPPDLETMFNGVDVRGKKYRFLRRIPVDPMTGHAEWGLRSVQDDPNATSFGGQNVYDVYSKSTASALDGTKYADW